MIVHYISTFTSMSPCANHFECRFTTLMSEDKENGHPSSCITERLNFMTQTIDMQKLQHMFSIQYLNSLTFFNMRLKSILKRYDRRDATTFATCCCTSLYQLCLSNGIICAILVSNSITVWIRKFIELQDRIHCVGIVTQKLMEFTLLQNRNYIYLGRRRSLAAWGHILRIFVGHTQPVV